MIRLVVNNGHHKDTGFDEIGLIMCLNYNNFSRFNR